MGLFFGKKCDCKRMFKGWLGPMPDIERSCKNACKTKTDLTKEEFLCSGNWIEQQVLMAAYGIDPCLNDEVTLGDYFDPLGDRENAKEKLTGLKDLFIILAILIAAGLGILFYIRK